MKLSSVTCVTVLFVATSPALAQTAQAPALTVEQAAPAPNSGEDVADCLAQLDQLGTKAQALALTEADMNSLQADAGKISELCAQSDFKQAAELQAKLSVSLADKPKK